MAIKQRLAMCARIQDNDGRYADANAVDEMMQYLGLDIIRCGIVRYIGASSWPRYDNLANRGYKFLFTVRDKLQPDRIIEELEEFESRFPGACIALEGWNEIDHNPVTYIDPVTGVSITDDAGSGVAHGWPTAAMLYHRDLYGRLRSSPTVRHIPLVAFSDFQQQTQWADYYNGHPYPRHGGVLSTGNHLKGLDRSTWITETGAPHRPDPRFYADATPESQRAFIEDAFGYLQTEPLIRMICLFQLMDSYDAGDDPAKLQDMEYAFGLFDYDYEPKLAAVRLRELVQSVT